jgi:sugar lactone lactonase YvrE
MVTLVVLALVLVLPVWAPADAQEASPVAGAAAQFIAHFDAAAGELSEGVAVAPDGTVYSTFSPLGQLVRLGPGEGEYEVVATVEGVQEGDIGMLGLAVATDGSVYAGVTSTNPEAHGVWRIDTDTGVVERVPGTEQIGLPNGIAFDADGTMYVTDTIAGAVWTVPPGGRAEQWLQHALLEGDGSLGSFPVGANGIALDVAGDTVYVAVTEQGSVATIPIAADGSAGALDIYVELGTDAEPMLPDGITFDAAGNLYVAAPSTNSVVRVTPEGTVAIVATAGDGLDGPASVAVDDAAGRLYISNFSIALVPPGGAGPGVVAIALGS